ncbi:energy transducer TonB [Paraburkholderia acidicola]|uniref:Protein TonB n=1 Tax=Paraburkholderia acidicola TaxID=1912599 RepID=A0ABV1LFV1_9BURK
MQALHSVQAGAPPVTPFRMNSRAAIATTVVLAIHVVLLAVVLTVRNELPSRPIESPAITAELLPPAAVAAPAAIQSIEPPKPTPPVPHLKPKVQPRPVPKPLPQAAAPSEHAITTPAPAPEPPAPAAPAAPPAPVAARPTMALTAPKDVSHLDCTMVSPIYPPLSTRRGESGTAYVKFVVGLTGKIQNIELKKSSGYSRLDDAALDAMRASTCKPYLENGEPVLATYTQPFDFGLKD